MAFLSSNLSNQCEKCIIDVMSKGSWRFIKWTSKLRCQMFTFFCWDLAAKKKNKNMKKKLNKKIRNVLTFRWDCKSNLLAIKTSGISSVSRTRVMSFRYSDASWKLWRSVTYGKKYSIIKWKDIRWNWNKNILRKLYRITNNESFTATHILVSHRSEFHLSSRIKNIQ